MEIKLTGKLPGIALVSLKDFDLVSHFCWHKIPSGYATGSVNGKMVRLHRFIMDAKKDQVVDHINRNKLDNRRENLRICTQLQNSQNKSISKNKSSKYRGVFYIKSNKKYRASFTYNKKYIHIGEFITEIEAAMAFDKYIVNEKLIGIELNFPDKKNDYIDNEYGTKKRNFSSKYIGVIYDKQRSKYKASIWQKHKCMTICFSNDELECAKAYDKYIVENNIPHKKLNFSDNYPNYIKNSIIKTKYENINDNAIRLIIPNHEELIVIIDKNDYDKVKNYAWTINDKKYIGAKINGSSKKLHRFLMDSIDPNEYIDHIDSNKYNNQKNNLRRSNAIKNAQNKSKTKNASSKFYGVIYYKQNNTWSSQVSKKKIGYDKNEIYAARRRDIYIFNNYSDSHYKLNFNWTSSDIDEINEWKNLLDINI